MIRLWSSIETSFKGNEWVLSECSKAEITEIINGEFSLTLEYPLSDTKGLSKYLLRGNVITCNVGDNRLEQQFRIRKVNKTSSKVVVYAQSKLIADLSSNRVKSMTIIGKTRKEAIQIILNNTLEKHSFVVGNLDNNANRNVILKIQEGTVLDALVGKENSILSEYGGEFIINNNEFNIVDNRGFNNKFTIAYGKNISGIKETIDDTDLVTVLIPKIGDLRLPEYCVESNNVNKYEKRYFNDVQLSNIKIWDGIGEQPEDSITKEQAYSIMRDTCNKMFTIDKVDQINFNYSIDLVTLRKIEEYKNYNILEKTNIGDMVKVKHKLLNLDLIGRINKTLYNVLLDKYIELEIGFAKKDITDIINSTLQQIQFTKQEILLSVANVENTLSSEIKLTEESITSSVNNKIDGVNSYIQQNANNINFRIDNLIKDSSTSLDLLDDKMSAVVEEGDENGSWELSKDAFKVAFSGTTNDWVKIDSKGIIAENSDGGYTRLGSKGLEHLNSKSGSGTPYHYWTQIGTITFTKAEDIENREINLDPEFKGTRARGMACIKKMTCNGATACNWIASYISDVDTDSLTATISGQANYRDMDNQNQTGGTVVVSYLIVG